MISITIFKNKFDNKTHKRMNFDSFDDFEKFLYKLSYVKIANKEKSQLISPATYKPKTKRANVNVINWAGWAALDIDTWKPCKDLKQVVIDTFGKYRFVCYSTPTSTFEQPKFRMVFALKEPLEADKIKGFWYALNSLAQSTGDKQTKDLSRMFYIPGDYGTSENQFIFSNDGEYMDTEELINLYPSPVKNSNSFFDRLPEGIQKQIIERRKAKLTNTNFSWTSYKNCPFWPKKLEREYRAISTTGWYHKMYMIQLSIARNAIREEYPITPAEIAELCSEFDADTGGWYKSRPLETEAERALEYAYRG